MTPNLKSLFSLGCKVMEVGPFIAAFWPLSMTASIVSSWGTDEMFLK